MMSSRFDHIANANDFQTAAIMETLANIAELCENVLQGREHLASWQENSSLIQGSGRSVSVEFECQLSVCFFHSTYFWKKQYSNHQAVTFTKTTHANYAEQCTEKNLSISKFDLLNQY